MVALPVALLVAVLYFFLAPTPPEKLLLSPGARQGDAPEPSYRWTEWRTPEFEAYRASLDRSDPEAIVREVFNAFRDHRYRRVLAYSTRRLQERNTPEALRRRLAFAEGFTGWDEILIDDIDATDDRVVVDGRSVNAESTHYYRAMLVPEDEGWVFDYLRVSPTLEDRDDRWPRLPEGPPDAPLITPRHPAPPAPAPAPQDETPAASDSPDAPTNS